MMVLRRRLVLLRRLLLRLLWRLLLKLKSGRVMQRWELRQQLQWRRR